MNRPLIHAVHSTVCALLLVVLHLIQSSSPIGSKQSVITLNGPQVPSEVFDCVDQMIPSVNPFHLLLVMRTRQKGRSHRMESGLDLLRCAVYSLVYFVCVCVCGAEAYFKGKLEVASSTSAPRLLLFSWRLPQLYEPITIIFTVVCQPADTWHESNVMEWM